MDRGTPTTFTREQLYELIWEEPTRTVAARLGISDVGLAKVCRKYHIPRPWRGYWREKETGKRVRQPKLLPWPPHLGQEPTTITFHTTPPPSPPGAPVPPRPLEPETVQAQRLYESDPAHQITVAEALAEPDRMVRRALRLLRKKDERGYHFTREHPCLAIHATTDSLDRALRIFDALLKACRARGWAVECQADTPWHTRVTVLDEVIAVGITEKVRTIRAPRIPFEDRDWLKPQPKDTYEPTGKLTLWLGANASSYGYERTWSDGKRQRVETCLHDVMLGFVQIVEARKAARREVEERQRRWAEEERQRQMEAERWEREKERREELQRQVQAWSEARDLQAYLAALQTASRSHIERDPDGRLARWLRWTEAHVAAHDPLRSVEQLPHDPQGWYRKPIDLSDFGISPANR
ncbi:MAG: hypothetical protein IPG75_19805 [Gemmatimonadetes bacterium]|nr:hypothetical protein [Gemmatimonadota bacterium]